jgi:hypothetical protein
MFDFLLYHRFDDYGTLKRTVFVDLTCEKCGHRYGHAMTRTRRAIGDRYVWQSREKYRDKYVGEARRELDAKLACGVEVVPCPECGWIQSSMLDRARQERYPAETWPALTAFTIVMIALVGIFVLWELEKAFRLNWVNAWISLSTTFGLMVCCGGACILREALRARRYDPNSAPREELIELGKQTSLSWEQFQALFPDDAAIQIEKQKAAACRTETSV